MENAVERVLLLSGNRKDMFEYQFQRLAIDIVCLGRDLIMPRIIEIFHRDFVTDLSGMLDFWMLFSLPFEETVP